MLNLVELRRVVGLIERDFAGARLRRVLELDRWEIGLELETDGPRQTRRRELLLLSCRPGLGRISRLGAAPEKRESPRSFVQFLRAHLMGGRLEGVRIVAEDRIAGLRFRCGEDSWELRLALMGARSNLYLLDAESSLRMALRPLDETRRDLELGGPWRDPEPVRRSEGEDRFGEVPDEAYLEALEEAATEKRGADRSDELARRLRRVLRRRVQTLERKVSHLEEDLGAGERAGQLERDGELLKSVLGRVRPRQSQVEASDPATGELRVIPLDPALSPGANLEAIFRRYRKELRRARRAGEELEGVRDRLQEAQGLSQQLETILESGPDAQELEGFSRLAEVERLLARANPPPRKASTRPSSRGRGKPGVPARLLPRRYQSLTGLEIWVGRSDLGNDALTTRLSRGNDLFFHLDGNPGSHVVLRTEGRTDPPSEAVLEACELAVHFSKQRGASRAQVHVAPIKQVRKPPGAKPGLVSVRGGRTVSLRHEPARLRRVLEARIEEGPEPS